MSTQVTRPVLMLALAALSACAEPVNGHGPVADDIFGRLGDPVPYATPEQRETFARGIEVMKHRFSRHDGLGPGFNVTFCGGCHEKPVIGGGSGLYRNFFIGKENTATGAQFDTISAGNGSSVVRLYYYDKLPELVAAYDMGEDDQGNPVDNAWCNPTEYSPTARPPVDPAANAIGQRNPVAFFGVGLMAQIDSDAILAHEDPDDADGDGISGRANYVEGFVGRFGVKAQTASIEGFIRGPMNNHLGITTDPLTQAEKAALPIDSSDAATTTSSWNWLGSAVQQFAQAAAPAGPLTDDDCVPDPEMSPQMLFDVVSFSMLLAAPQFDAPTETSERGRVLFDDLNCAGCHVPRLDSPRGPIPLYSDLLLHDMGEDLSDGLRFAEASEQEFRTPPLWGVAATAPYLHDGRASTLTEAISMHGGEASRSRNAWAALDASDQADLEAFLLSLGGRDQYTPGLGDLNAPLDDIGTYGGPVRALTPTEAEVFLAGRTLFDTEFGVSQGTGGPRFNGDSCRACHFDPVFGGAGPSGVNVIRHGVLNGDGAFVPPTVGTVLHRSTALKGTANLPQEAAAIFELRNTPHLFGLGLIESIPDAAILANADPDDTLTPDGISGKPSWTDGERLGRFGWKSSVPTIEEFVRDAVTTELGMTLGHVPGLTFGRLQDNDAVPDPEFSQDDADLLTTYLGLLAPPPRQVPADAALAEQGETLFDTLGCTSCHIPALEGRDGPVPLYSDLLLHEILPADALGIEEASATMREFRTAPLWGLSQTAPYLHTGAADTVDEAIDAHAAEGQAAADAWRALDDAERAALRAFLETL